MRNVLAYSRSRTLSLNKGLSRSLGSAPKFSRKGPDQHSLTTSLSSTHQARPCFCSCKTKWRVRKDLPVPAWPRINRAIGLVKLGIRVFMWLHDCCSAHRQVYCLQMATDSSEKRRVGKECQYV